MITVLGIVESHMPNVISIHVRIHCSVWCDLLNSVFLFAVRPRLCLDNRGLAARRGTSLMLWWDCKVWQFCQHRVPPRKPLLCPSCSRLHHAREKTQGPSPLMRSGWRPRARQGCPATRRLRHTCPQYMKHQSHAACHPLQVGRILGPLTLHCCPHLPRCTRPAQLSPHQVNSRGPPPL